MKAKKKKKKMEELDLRPGWVSDLSRKILQNIVNFKRLQTVLKFVFLLIKDIKIL